jgi:hypothetical protein
MTDETITNWREYSDADLDVIFPEMRDTIEAQAKRIAELEGELLVCEHNFTGAAIELDERREQCEELAALLRRYRKETPLGHQPHMIAHQADEALAKLDGADLDQGQKADD